MTAGSPPPDLGRSLPLIVRTLTGSSLLVLVVGALVNARGQATGELDVLATVAIVWALAVTVVAVSVRGRGLVAERPLLPPGDAATAAAARKTLVFFALLESGVMLCGVALVVARPWTPFFAALVPFALMLLNAPRRGD